MTTTSEIADAYAGLLEEKMAVLADDLQFWMFANKYGPIDPIQTNEEYQTCPSRLSFDLGGPGGGTSHVCELTDKHCTYGHIPGDCHRRSAPPSEWVRNNILWF